MNFPHDPIDKFAGHVAAMRFFLEYITIMMQTVPIVMTKLTEQQRQEIIEPCVLRWINYVRELYNQPDLYTGPRNPLHVDPKCSGWALSDHIKERLGRNNPCFDFVNAPFTHPLGTQISLICVNYCWDAYDTFIKEVLGIITSNYSKNPECRKLAENQKAAKKQNQSISTNEMLATLRILPNEEEISWALKANYSSYTDLRPELVPITIQVAKELRTCFAHRFGQPSEKLIRLIKSIRFQDFPIRLTDDGFEVTLVLSRMIAQIIQLMAGFIDYKAREIYR